MTLKLYNYNFLKKKLIRRAEKHFIKRLNITALDTISMSIKISSVYTPHIIGLSLNQLITYKNIAVIYIKQ